MGYEDLETFYEYFDDTVYLDYFNDSLTLNTHTTKSIEDHFLNKETQDDFKEDCLVDSSYYAYFAVKLCDVNPTIFSDMCLYIRGEEDAQLELKIYVVSSLPSIIRAYNDPLYELDTLGNIKLDTEGNPITLCDDNYVNPYSTVVVNLKKGEFVDIYVNRWEVNGDTVKKITLNPDDYLLIQFVNNTGYGKDLSLPSVKFTMTNFIFNKG